MDYFPDIPVLWVHWGQALLGVLLILLGILGFAVGQVGRHRWVYIGTIVSSWFTGAVLLWSRLTGDRAGGWGVWGLVFLSFFLIIAGLEMRAMSGDNYGRRHDD